MKKAMLLLFMLLSGCGETITHYDGCNVSQYTTGALVVCGNHRIYVNRMAPVNCHDDD